MKIYLSLLLLVILLVFYSCALRTNSYWESETKKMRDCRARWCFMDLDKTQEVTVLLFQGKSHFHIYAYPNFLIGITASQDTIAFMDIDFSETLRKGEKVKIEVLRWSEIEKEILKPLFVVHKSNIENDLYCKVDTVFYGKIDKVLNR